MAAGGKWSGKAEEVITAPIDKVWPIISDFDGLHKLFPEIFESCETIEGEINKVGSLRALVAPLPDGSKVEAKERLVSLDNVNHTTVYTIENINLGWTGYKAEINAKSLIDGSTHVNWTFELDPLSDQTEEEFMPTQVGLFQGILNLSKGLLAK